MYINIRNPRLVDLWIMWRIITLIFHRFPCDVKMSTQSAFRASIPVPRTTFSTSISIQGSCVNPSLLDGIILAYDTVLNGTRVCLDFPRPSCCLLLLTSTDLPEWLSRRSCIGTRSWSLGCSTHSKAVARSRQEETWSMIHLIRMCKFFQSNSSLFAKFISVQPDASRGFQMCSERYLPKTSWLGPEYVVRA